MRRAYDLRIPLVQRSAGMAIEAGQQLLHYRLIEKIGEGGMGVVWKAEDTKLHRRVALKFLADRLQNDATALARLRREAKSAAALDHPYICKVYDTGETEDGRAFIAMEYVEGETLASRLEREQPPLVEALRIAVEVAEALEKAHEKNIVHRDLKPANVMIGRDRHVKVERVPIFRTGC